MEFSPDYKNILAVLYNSKPPRLPLYEHHIDLPFISKCTGASIAPEGTKPSDYQEYYRKITGFWKDMTYDAFDFEASVCDIFPDHGAILGGRPGPVQTHEDFIKYPFDELPGIFRDTYRPHFEALRAVMPPGMKAYGGCGYGIFEAAEDLVGYEYLCTMQYLDPELFAALFRKIGDLYAELWTYVIAEYSDIFVFFRMGDDLGYRNSTLMEPDTLRNHVFPQYKRIIDMVHAAGKKFLLHSCGCIFEVMDDLIDLGIDAKHSNEDQIAPFSDWIVKYNDRIGLFGGIDVNTLCLGGYDTVYREVIEKGTEYRLRSKGYGIGSGNSIPGYVPVEGYMAMIDAVKEIRRSGV